MPYQHYFVGHLTFHSKEVSVIPLKMNWLEAWNVLNHFLQHIYTDESASLRFMKLFYWQKNNARKYTCRTPFCLVWNIVIINDNAKLPNIKKRNLPSILHCPYPLHKIGLHNLSLVIAPCICHLIKLVPVYGMLHSHCEEQYLDKQIKNMLKTNLYD